MYTEKDFETIKDIIIKDVPDVSSIILFGSYARGTAKEDSDMDVAILISNSIERMDRLKLLTALRWEIAQNGYDVDVLLKVEKEFLSEKDLPTISRVIFSEGKKIWQKV